MNSNVPGRAISAVSAWLVLATLGATPATADPGMESTITVAHADDRRDDAPLLAKANADDAARIRAEFRAAMQADLAATHGEHLDTLLAAARPHTGDD